MGIRHQNEILPEHSSTLGQLMMAENPQSCHRKIVKTLYKALANRDTRTTAKLVVPDLEWWFHGPPHCQHMMRTLTGESRHLEFKFRPRSIKAVGDRVVAEGWEGKKAYWVQVWTVKDGMITQLREYFNTWVTVMVRVSEEEDEMVKLWQSDSTERFRRSLPDIVPVPCAYGSEIHGLLNNKKVKKLKQREARKRMLRKAKDYIAYCSTE